MIAKTIIQGRMIGATEVELIRGLLLEHTEWNRTRLSKELCIIWNWRNAAGQGKDMAARTLLLKLEKRGMIVLPPRQNMANNPQCNQSLRLLDHDQMSVVGPLQALLPLSIHCVGGKVIDLAVFKSLITQHHYLGLQNTVGENLKYLARDVQGRVVGALLFGSAAWQTHARDTFIGWSIQERRVGLWLITNKPTRVGQTSGRTRNGVHGADLISIKDIYVYPLSKNIRRELCNDHP